MSVDFYNQIAQQVPQLSITPADNAPGEVRQKVMMLNGAVKNLNVNQLPAVNTYQINNVWRWPAVSLQSQVFAQGGQVTFKIDRGSGSGPIKGLRLRAQWTNPSSTWAVQYVPFPLMIQYIQILTPSGKIVQQFTGTDMYLALASVDDTIAWVNDAVAIQADPTNYGVGPAIVKLDSGYWYMPIVGNLFDMAFDTYLVDGDLMVNVTFFPNIITNLQVEDSGTFHDLTCLAMSLDAQMANVTSRDLTVKKLSLASQPLDFVAPYVKTQRFVMTLNSGSQYSFQLAGIKGDVVYAQLVIRPSVSGYDLLNWQPVDTFQYQNSAGQGISGQQLIEARYNRRVQFPEWSPGLFAAYQNIYTTVFAEPASALTALLALGQKQGAYGFTTNESVIINTTRAGVNEVLTLTRIPNATVTGGDWYIEFVADGEGAAYTQKLDYQANAKTVKEAIERINLFQGQVDVVFNTGTTGWAAAASMTITYTGRYANKVMAGNDYFLVAHSNSLLNSGGSTSLSTDVSTDGQFGITSGNTFTIDVYTWTTVIASINEQGGMDVIN